MHVLKCFILLITEQVRIAKNPKGTDVDSLEHPWNIRLLLETSKEGRQNKFRATPVPGPCNQVGKTWKNFNSTGDLQRRVDALDTTSKLPHGSHTGS